MTSLIVCFSLVSDDNFESLTLINSTQKYRFKSQGGAPGAPPYGNPLGSNVDEILFVAFEDMTFTSLYPKFQPNWSKNVILVIDFQNLLQNAKIALQPISY